jgi:hypothetical protein
MFSGNKQKISGLRLGSDNAVAHLAQTQGVCQFPAQFGAALSFAD